MYWIAAGLAVAVFSGAVIYENQRQKAVWKRFYDRLSQLEGAGAETCPG